MMLIWYSYLFLCMAKFCVVCDIIPWASLWFLWYCDVTMAELLVMQGEDVIYLILGIMIILGSGCVCVTCCSAFRGRHEEEKWMPAPEYAPKTPHSWHKDPYKGLPPPRTSERFKVRKFRMGPGKGGPPEEKWRRSRDKLVMLKNIQRTESPRAPRATQNAPAPEVSTISGNYEPPPQYSQIPVVAPTNSYPW